MDGRRTATSIVLRAAVFVLIASANEPLASADSGNGPTPSLLATTGGESTSPDIAAGVGPDLRLDAKWAVRVLGDVVFNAMCSDDRGSIYAVGSIKGEASFSSTFYAHSPPLGSALVVKFNPKGAPEWARTAAQSSAQSDLTCVALDGFGNIYAAGVMLEGTIDFGQGVTATGRYSGANMLVVKLDSNGRPLWARSAAEPDGDTDVYSVAVDNSGCAYVAGLYYSGSQMDFEQKALGFSRSPKDGAYGMIVKFDGSGSAMWVAASTADMGYTCYYAVAVSGADVYASGYSYAQGNVSFGDGVVLRASGYESGFASALLVKYSDSGRAQWARSCDGGQDSRFKFVAINSSGSVYAAGQMAGDWVHDFGNGITAQGSSKYRNPLAVKYDSTGTPLWARSQTGGANGFVFRSGAIQHDNLYLACEFNPSSGKLDFGNRVVADGWAAPSGRAMLCLDGSGIAKWTASVDLSVQGGPVQQQFSSFCLGPLGEILISGVVSGADGRLSTELAWCILATAHYQRPSQQR